LTSQKILDRQVSGDGLALATAVAPPNLAVPGLQGNSIGAVFNPTIDVQTLNHAPILSLIRFYNEDFGVALQASRHCPYPSPEGYQLVNRAYVLIFDHPSLSNKGASSIPLDKYMDEFMNL
jgi:hypothetical protein